MPGSDVQMDLSFSALFNMNNICTFAHVTMNALVSTVCYLATFCCCRWTHHLSLVFVQVFGDYYHFRHHAVEKRALSGHRGMHIRLEKEQQVRLLSVLTLLIAATKGQKRGCVSLEKRMPASVTVYQTLNPLQSTPVLPSVPLTLSKVPHSCKYGK